jgi:hypothetical protein
MVTNKHRQKYLVSLLSGLGLVSGGVLVIIYASFLKDRKDEWYIWGAVAIMLVNSGLFLLGNAFVHKVKADLIRKQKQKDLHKKYEFE